MPTTTTSIEVTRTSTTQELPLGFIVREPPTTSALRDTGEREWVYVKTDDALVEGNVCTRKDATVTRTVVKSPIAAVAASHKVVGVAQHSIAAGSYGFILRRGIGEVIADTGGITANTALQTGNAVAGTADDLGAVTSATFGYSTEAATATNKATCWIDCRG